ncbi:MULTISPECIES: hypothetical protein [Halobacteriales]|jgi:hypothetical protein|uniref:DUF3784 domain-containing protein n=17 Tax=Halobacteriales TaxID=2235 RepID=Q5V714_HALMA|nr:MULTISPECIES: hypothetical protein [Halobacteria]OYR79469.1 hypothetical protein DJ71_16490 [Halorubrum sp. E3]AAV44594.1 unknown [Haloarcula marismortui ATCC 43049]EMA27614.1 hypothetical protein C444_19047 [Haloarcula japonica DSM 6131]KAB7513555.1 hypothetical protein DMP03_11520 [Halosegnis rubeus]MBP2252806.1 hypothetical protein [Halarchaeum solikamskense]
MSDLSTADQIAMYVGGGLVVLGVVVIGLLDMLLGAGHPVDSEGAIEHAAVVPIDIRAGIILLGLVIWGLVAVYKFAAGSAPSGSTTGQTPSGMDD